MPAAEQVLAVPPPCPELLKQHPQASSLWHSVTRELVLRQLLTTSDLEALTVLCDHWQIYCDCREVANSDAAYFTTEQGYVAAHPAVYRMQNVVAVLDKLWRKFGLTPVDREQLNVEVTGRVLGGGSVRDFAARKPR